MEKVVQEEEKEEEVKKAPGDAKKRNVNNNKKPSTVVRDLNPKELEEFKKFEKERLTSITNEIVEYFPRLMLFHSLAVTMCAIRSPTDATVVLTYFTILLRIISVFGWYCKRKCLYLTAGAFEGLINVILFLITLSYNPY